MEQNTVRKIWNVISALILLLVVAAEGILFYRIYGLMMIPDTYLLVLQGVMILVTVVIGLLIFRGRWSEAPGYGKRILGYLLSVLVLGLCWYGQTAIGQVHGTIAAVTEQEKASIHLEVYIRAEDSAESLGAAEACVLAVSENTDDRDISETVAELEQLLGRTVTLRSYPHIAAQVDALLSGEADAVALDSAYMTILETMDSYADFTDQTKLLHERMIEKDASQVPMLPENDVPRELDVTKDTFLMYISGSDSRYAMLSTGRSDVNILVAVNPTTHQVLLINTPRDYYVINPASGRNAMDKLTHCGVQGVENSMAALEWLYDQEIDYYARINFAGLETLIDSIGGVTFHADRAFYAGNSYIRQGENQLNGRQALEVARERKNLPGGDNDRGKNQMKLIAAIVDQLSAGNLAENYTQILQSLEGMFQTDLTAEQIGDLVQMQLSQLARWEVFSYAVTGENGTDHCWASGVYAYVMYPNRQTVDHASGLIESMRAGEKLTAEDMTNGS